MTTALIDGDIVLYRAVCGAEDIDPWGDSIETEFNLEKAQEAFTKIVEAWTQTAGCKKPVVCLSDPEGGNFRKDLLPTYKGNRSGDKPEGYWETYRWAQEEFKCWAAPNLEADDIMGIMSSGKPGRYVIVSLDKDMATIPGLFMVPGKDKKPKEISEAEADYAWMTQALTGDTVDNYKGAPGIGPKKAEKILNPNQPLRRLWRAVVKTFRDKGLTKDDALVQARVARILRSTDYDRDTREITLWEPEK